MNGYRWYKRQFYSNLQYFTPVWTLMTWWPSSVLRGGTLGRRGRWRRRRGEQRGSPRSLLTHRSLDMMMMVMIMMMMIYDDGGLEGTMIMRYFICSAEYMLSKVSLLRSKHLMQKYRLFFYVLLKKRLSRTAANNWPESDWHFIIHGMQMSFRLWASGPVLPAA